MKTNDKLMLLLMGNKKHKEGRESKKEEKKEKGFKPGKRAAFEKKEKV